MARESPARRPFVLSRAMFAGTQVCAAAPLSFALDSSVFFGDSRCVFVGNGIHSDGVPFGPATTKPTGRTCRCLMSKMFATHPDAFVRSFCES